MRLPFVIMRRSDHDALYEELYQYQESMNSFYDQLQSKTTVLDAVEEAMPAIRQREFMRGVEWGKTYIKRELLKYRHRRVQ